MYWYNRCTFICMPCRFTSKYAGQCPQCRGTLRAMYDFQPPRKRDDRGWKKVELEALVQASNIQLCTWSCCIPISRPARRGYRVKDLTLSELKARIRKQREHRQGEVPRYYSYK